MESQNETTLDPELNLMTQATQLFHSCDLNSDGILTKRELSKALTLHSSSSDAIIATLDLPALTELLRPKHLHETIQNMDLDGDNSINLDEFLDFIDQLAEDSKQYARDEKIKRLSKAKQKAALAKQALEHTTYCARLGFLACRLRLAVLINVTESSHQNESKHLSTCFAAAEVVSVILFHLLKWNPLAPIFHVDDPDAFVLSDGRLAPIWWAALREAQTKHLPSKQTTLYGLKSPMDAMPTYRSAPFFRVSCGSTGTGLAAACGIAWTRKGRGRRRCFCLLAGHELGRGIFWESVRLASDLNLYNLITIVLFHADEFDGNCNQRMLKESNRLSGFGWNVYINEDGHEVESFLTTLTNATTNNHKGKPTCILLRVIPGSGSRLLERRPHSNTTLLRDEEKMNVLRRRLDRLAKGAGNVRVPKLSARASIKTPVLSSRPNTRSQLMTPSSMKSSPRNHTSKTPTSPTSPTNPSRDRSSSVTSQTSQLSIADAANAKYETPDRSLLTFSLQEIEHLRNEKHVTINNDPQPDLSKIINEIIVIDGRSHHSRPMYNPSGIDVATESSISAAVGFGLGACTEGKRCVVVGGADGWSSSIDSIKSAGFTLYGYGLQNVGPQKPKPDPRAKSTIKRNHAMKTNHEHHRALALAGVKAKPGPKVLAGLESRGKLILLSVSSGSKNGSTSGWGEMVHDDIGQLNLIHGMCILIPCDEISARAMIRLSMTSKTIDGVQWRLFYIRTDATTVIFIEEEENRRGMSRGSSRQSQRSQNQRHQSQNRTRNEDDGYMLENGTENDNEFIDENGIYGASSLFTNRPLPTFRIGGSNVLRTSFEDQLTLIACGPTCVRNCLRAHDELLRTYGVVVRVLDLYCLAPVDKWNVLRCFTETRFLVTVENHGSKGGMNQIVSSLCPVELVLASKGIDVSGTQVEMERESKYDVYTIVQGVVNILAKEQGPLESVPLL